MNYTPKQIENAKKAYNEMLVYRTVESYQPEFIGTTEAERRCEFHNNIVSQILAGNQEVANEWKKFFLLQEVKAAQKAEESKAKKQANLDASADILAPVKSAKKLVAFGVWLNTSGNQYRSQHFSKKYTQEAVNAFMNTL
jgi:hypothetical protein